MTVVIIPLCCVIIFLIGHPFPLLRRALSCRVSFPLCHTRAGGYPLPSRHAQSSSGIQSKESVFRDSGQPIPCHPWAWPEDPGQRILIFGGMSKVSKSGIHVAWILAFARMTIGDASAPGTTCHERWFPLCRHPWAWPEGPGQ